MQQPHKRLKFENVPHVTIFSVHAYCFIAWLQQGGKDHWKTHNSVHKCQRICFSAVINSRKAKAKAIFHKWKCSGDLLAWLLSSWIDYLIIQHFSRSVTMSFFCFTTIVSWYWLFSAYPLQSLRAHARTRSRTSYKVTGLRGNVFKFNLLHGHCTFLPFPFTLTSLYTLALSNSPSELGRYTVELVIALYGAHINWKFINWILTWASELIQIYVEIYISPRTEIWLWNGDITMWNGASIVEWERYCRVIIQWRRYKVE